MYHSIEFNGSKSLVIDLKLVFQTIFKHFKASSEAFFWTCSLTPRLPIQSRENEFFEGSGLNSEEQRLKPQFKTVSYQFNYYSSFMFIIPIPN